MAQTGRIVDLELVLAVDTSSSINAEEYRLQMQGLAQAFRSPDVLEAVRRSGRHGIAVVLVHWAEDASQAIAVPWTWIGDTDSARRFADRIARAPRSIIGGATAIGNVLAFAVDELERNEFRGLRRVIDLSGDGRANHGFSPERGRDIALKAHVTVNALAILNEIPMLDRYFRDTVIGGPGAFVLVAKDWRDYGDAILRKLIREISDTPLATRPEGAPARALAASRPGTEP